MFRPPENQSSRPHFNIDQTNRGAVYRQRFLFDLKTLSPTTLKILLVSRGSLQQKNCVFVCVFLTEEQTHKTCKKTLKCKRKCRDNMLNALYSLGVTIVQGYYHHEISCLTTGNSIWSYLDKLGSKWTSASKCHSLKSFEGSFESWSQPFPWQRSLNWLDYVLEEKFHSLGSVIISVTAALLQRNARAEMCSDEICSQLGSSLSRAIMDCLT